MLTKHEAKIKTHKKTAKTAELERKSTEKQDKKQKQKQNPYSVKKPTTTTTTTTALKTQLVTITATNTPQTLEKQKTPGTTTTTTTTTKRKCSVASRIRRLERLLAAMKPICDHIPRPRDIKCGRRGRRGPRGPRGPPGGGSGLCTLTRFDIFPQTLGSRLTSIPLQLPFAAEPTNCGPFPPVIYNPDDSQFETGVGGAYTVVINNAVVTEGDPFFFSAKVFNFLNVQQGAEVKTRTITEVPTTISDLRLNVTTRPDQYFKLYFNTTVPSQSTILASVEVSVIIN